jgi:hypothetical protein
MGEEKEIIPATKLRFPISLKECYLMYYVEDWVLYYKLFNFSSKSTDIMYLYLTCSISYGVNLYLDLRNVNKFSLIKDKIKSVLTSSLTSLF